MDVEARAAIILRIEEARAREPGGAIAFDGDGTLWSGDVGDDYFNALITKNDFRPPATEGLRTLAREMKLTDAGEARAVAQRIFDAYLAHAVAEDRVCEMMAWATAGWSFAELDAFCAEIVQDRALKTRLHREAVGVLAWAVDAKIDVFLVSASPRAIVCAAADVVGIDHARVIASTPRTRDGHVLCDVERPIPYGDGKVRGIEARIGARVLYAAFGDNAFDVAMLRRAKVPVAVRPKPRLTARAPEIPGLVQIAPEI